MPTRVLFVCLGNICRSPTAHGMLEFLVVEAGLTDRIEVDSAGTGSWHIGDPPDERSQAAAKRRGLDLSRQRARQVIVADFEAFDFVIAMDENNLADLEAMCPSEYRERLGLLMDYAPESGVRAVPDPYYGGGNGFERVLDLVESACKAFLKELR